MPKFLVATDLFDSPVSVPIDTDSRNAASVEGPFQQLTNRTRNLALRVGGESGSSTWTYTDSAGNPITHTRLALVGPRVGRGEAGWIYTQQDSAFCNVNSHKLFIDFVSIVTNLANITQIQALVKPGEARATEGNRMSLKFYRIATGAEFTSPFGVPVETVFGSEDFDDGTANRQVLTTGTFSDAAKRDQNLLVARIVAGNTATTFNDQFYGIRVLHDEFGPRPA